MGKDTGGFCVYTKIGPLGGGLHHLGLQAGQTLGPYYDMPLYEVSLFFMYIM